MGQKVASSDEIKGMIKIVEEFLINKTTTNTRNIHCI